MSKTITFIFCLIATFIQVGTLSATSLDDLYRDIIRSDNQGYLPLFVKNRTIPHLDVSSSLDNTPPPSSSTSPKQPIVNLTNDRRQKEEQLKTQQQRWENAIKAVQQSNVTPLDLEEINNRVKLNDSKAIEILAWMYTKGVGVKQDLITAFKLYRKAESLKVPSAGRNATLIYKAMSPEQRAILKNQAF